jgi:SAM-dependent methyltransferase
MMPFKSGLLQRLSQWLPADALGKRMAEAKRYWSLSDRSINHQDQSHWRGKGRWIEENWKRIGEDHYGVFRELCDITGRRIEDVATVLEWGPGGGSNVVAFLKTANAYYGVDISQPNLDECIKQCEAESIKGFIPLLINVAEPESCLSSMAGRIDLFLSTAVFQHFPSKEYGRRVLQIGWDRLNDDGLGLIQIRYDNNDPRFRAKNRNYRKNVTTFNSYAIDEFWDMCAEVGFVPLAVRLNTKVNYAFFFLVKSKI